ncbi:MAG: hypothetical protein ACLFV7_14015 [Phycisphaerae bacterium]
MRNGERAVVWNAMAAGVLVLAGATTALAGEPNFANPERLRRARAL